MSVKTMAMDHPLDRVVHSALTSERQSGLAVRHGEALRMAPGFGIFAAVKALTPKALNDFARLEMPEGRLVTVEAEHQPVPPGLRVEKEAVLLQMTLSALRSAPLREVQLEKLGEADAGQMLELALLTEPGPFFEKTHCLGDFYGIKQDGHLLAMAGERMKPDGFTEVSGVCVHPDAQGRGYAAAAMRTVIEAVLARGEVVFLHSYDHNARAISLYEGLGFSLRSHMQMRTLIPA